MRKIFKLRFSSPVRFGPDNGGERLSSLRTSFHADTLFSALFIEALQCGRNEELLQAVSQDQLTLSDGFPFCGNDLFLPRPVGLLLPQQQENVDPSMRKLYKKIDYIPLNEMSRYISGQSHPTDLLAEFGVPMDQIRVNTRDQDQPLPYRVMGFRFFPDCGLYFIAECASEKELNLLRDLIVLLSASGIGGKASSGWGKFTVSEENIPAVLDGYLDMQSADRYMLLSCALPGDDLLESVLDGASWTLVSRGGYTGGATSPVKKQEIHVFAAGSTFTKRFSGQVIDVATHSPHPVWRCEKALMMGVKAN